MNRHTWKHILFQPVNGTASMAELFLFMTHVGEFESNVGQIYIVLQKSPLLQHLYK